MTLGLAIQPLLATGPSERQAVVTLAPWSTVGSALAFALERAPLTLNLNQLTLEPQPGWLKKERVEKIIDSVQHILEWDIRKIAVHWLTEQKHFDTLHGLGAGVIAFTRYQPTLEVFLGPQVIDRNFDGILAHELGHVILYQKYRPAIPLWLEEGLANYAARTLNVDYPWLAQQPPLPVLTLVHPFAGQDLQRATLPDSVRAKYMTSTALIEMIEGHCPVTELMQLSVGSQLERYLPTFCQIQDLDLELQAWIKLKAQSTHYAAPRPPKKQ